MMLRTTILALAATQAPPAGPLSSGPLLRADEVPGAISNVGIDENLGATIPTDLRFRTALGHEVRLEEVFTDRRPTILTFNYSDCPMLCSVQLNFFAETLAAMRWDLGKEYRVVTVSLDPAEDPSRASRTRDRYLKTYGRALPPNEAGWEFLVGDEPSIRRLADTVGFRYARNSDTGEYLHTAALIILTGDAKVSRYLYGIKPSPETLRLSLVEASQGHFVSSIDRVLLYCFHYDPKAGSYTLVAANIMRIGAALTILVLAFVVGRTFLRRGAARKPLCDPPERSNVA